MKSINYLKIAVLGLIFPCSAAFGQFVDVLPETATSGGGYMVGDLVEVGINWGGHEGTWDTGGAPWCPNERGATYNPEVQVGFVSNPAADGWGNYDGCFFSPGTPENGFGLELGGVNYSNNASNSDWSSGLPTQEEIPGDIIGFDIINDCMEVEWEGIINGIQVNVLYKLVSTELFYTTVVTLTNTNAVDELDIYYYRNFDPDNNQPIGWSFTTTNTIVEQPDVTCEMALVSAEQFNIWDNYIGLGAFGSQFRVTYGGFTNRDGGDIWLGNPPFTQLEGSVTVADQAISLGYYIDNLEAGTSEQFQFAVIMSSADVDAALSSLYYIDYAGSTSSIDDCDPLIDTIQICPGGTTTLSVDGPSSGDYDWAWTPPIGLSTTVGVTTDASPPTTTTYTVTGTPTVSCLSTTISTSIVVDILSPPAGPDTSGVTCNDAGSIVELWEFLIDSVGAGFWEETSIPLSGGFDGDSTFIPGGVPFGTYTFDYIVLGVGGCPNDTLGLTIDVNQEVTAGADGAASLCQSDMIDLDLLLSGADPGGTWDETTFSGAFDAITAEFTPLGVPGGFYTFTYEVTGTAPCPNDIADFVVEVWEDPIITVSTDDSDNELCETDIITITADGAGSGATYVWDNGITNSVPFVQPVGTTTYNVVATDVNGCQDFGSTTVIMHPFPNIDFVAGEPLGCEPHWTDFTGTSDQVLASCVWTWGDGNEYKLCGSAEHTYQDTGMYDVTWAVVDENGCVNSITKADYIEVQKTPIAAFEWNPWELVVEQTECEFDNQSRFSTNWEWDFGDGTPTNNEEHPTHEFPKEIGDIEYYVTLTAYNDIGCVDETHRLVPVKDIIIFYIPNIFTPDGDQYNETFKPAFFSGIDIYDFTMTIYNRYGEIMFVTHNTESGWDGTYGSRGLIQDGTYVWQIEFKENMSDKRHKRHGHVTILK